MGRSSYRTILYLTVVTLIVLGAVLFFFRDRALTYLSEQTKIQPVATSTKVVLSVKETLNTDVLKSARFKDLKDNVVNFDFDKVCLRPNVKTEATEVPLNGEEEAVATTSAPVKCVLGNNNPFFIKDAK